MKKRIQTRLCAALVLTALTFVVSCAGAPQNQFMAANAPTIEKLKLANGMTLIVKKNPANRVYAMKLVYLGGSALVEPSKAGIEAMTLDLMARGSKKYSYDDIQRIMYECSSSIGSGASTYDWSSFDISTIDTYWDTMLDVYTDCVLHPAFAPEQFELVKNDSKLALQKSASDPYGVAVDTLHKKMFEGHPYGAEPDGNLASVSSITLDDIRAWYKTMSADRMFIVAVGNFNTKKLVSDLNKTFGALPKKETAKLSVAPYSAKQALYMEPFPKSKGIAYIRGDYPIPAVTSPEHVALQLADSILGEMLFSIVRTEHGACYSVWARTYEYASPYGSYVIYKTDQASNSKVYFDEAIAILASGKTLNPKSSGDDTDAAHYAPLAETLETYKAKFINSFFANQQTNAETAAQLASGYIYFGDPAEYLRFIDKVHAVTASDIVAVTKKYLINNATSWIIVADQATLDKVDKKKFEGFTGIVK